MPLFSKGYDKITGPNNIELAAFPTPDAESPSREIVDERQQQYDTGEITRIISLSGLVVSVIFGIACVVVGSGAVTKHIKAAHVDSNQDAQHDWPDTGLGNDMMTAELVPLLVTFFITFLMESMGLIHSTTLRWALRDDLNFNSNLRLFTASPSAPCFSTASNVLYAIFIVVSYAATSLMFAIEPSREFCDFFSDPSIGAPLGDEGDRGCDGTVALATPAVCALGVSLLGQAALVMWQMLSTSVPTWSANPLDTAWASVNSGMRSRVPGRCMMSIHDEKLSPGPQRPRLFQSSIWSAHREVRRIMYYIWTLTVLCYVWFAAVQARLQTTAAKSRDGGFDRCNGCNNYLGSSWTLLPDRGSTPTSAAVIVEYRPSFYIGMFVLVCIFQGFLTLALHCAELIANLRRDEQTWRKCYSTHGYPPRPNALLRAGTSWIAVTLFLLKGILHFLFGKGMTYAYNWGIFLRPPQLLYLSLGTTILAAFTTFLSFRTSAGEQPATFGHVQTLVDLVDQWSLLMFWGDKGLKERDDSMDPRIRHAGTASNGLDRILVNALYAGD